MMSSAEGAGSPAGVSGESGQPMSLMPIITTTVSAWGCASTSCSKRARAFTPIRSLSTRAPEMPSLSTETLAPVAAMRSASTSGQRLFSFGVELSPSVIKSPKSTTLRAPSLASTSRPERKIRALVVTSALIASAAVWSPAPMKAVWRPSLCQVVVGVTSGR